MECIKYGDLSFQSDFTCAVNTQLEKIKFSKYERALLKEFTHKPNRLLSREHLLNAISTLGSDAVDRNIDYLICRLRRKLNDTPRAPRYISTLYGEGYSWIANKQSTPEQQQNQIFLSIGPIYGLASAQSINPQTTQFVENIMTSMQTNFGNKYQVVRRPSEIEQTSEQLWAHNHSKYALELSFLSLDETVICTLVALNRKSGHIFGTFRYRLPNINQYVQEQVINLAKEIYTQIVQKSVFRLDEQRSINEEPLVTSLYKAAELFEPGTEGLNTVEEMLRERLSAHPDDHKAAILLATNLHNQMFLGDFTNEEEKHREIETLIMHHLPCIQDDALYLSAAAERLFALGHHELACSLAERALDLGPSLAACYMVNGRIHVMQGSFAEGIAYYDHAMEMSEPDSTFYQMLYTMKCLAYKANGDLDKVRDMSFHILQNEADEKKRFALRIYLLGDDDRAISPQAVDIAASVPAASVTHLLKIANYVAARLFVKVIHRENILKSALTFFTQTHGVDVIPAEIQSSIPNYCKKLVSWQVRTPTTSSNSGSTL